MHWEVTGDDAYIVMPAVFSGVAGGNPFKVTGIETYILEKVGGTWKVLGWAFAETG